MKINKNVYSWGKESCLFRGKHPAADAAKNFLIFGHGNNDIYLVFYFGVDFYVSISAELTVHNPLGTATRMLAPSSCFHRIAHKEKNAFNNDAGLQGHKTTPDRGGRPLPAVPSTTT